VQSFDLAFKKRTETKLECYDENCGTFEPMIAENTHKVYAKRTAGLYS
jgi:hypothetical protein